MMMLKISLILFLNKGVHMEEVMVKTHLIVTDIHEEYHMNWCGKLINARPKLKNGKPIFIIISKSGRIELNTFDIKQIEKTAKLLTNPKGRQSITTDTARIFLKEENGNQKLMGILTHNHIKDYAPMYDKVYKE